MLRRIWELHRTIILVGAFGLAIGVWLGADSETYHGVVLENTQSGLVIYKESGQVVTLGRVEGLTGGSFIEKISGEACCVLAGGALDESRREALRERHRRYWSTWSGQVIGFVAREHADDADTALIELDGEGNTVRWKVWEAHLAGLQKGERLCKPSKSWSPMRCNPEAGVVEFKAHNP